MAKAAKRTKRAVQRVAADVRDTADEAAQRVRAAGERGKRKALGKEMTTSERLASKVKETGARTRAGIDRAKRKLRDST